MYANDMTTLRAKRNHFKWLPLVLFILVLPIHEAAAQYSIGKVLFKQDVPLSPTSGGFGYVPYTFSVTNTDYQRNHKVTFALSGRSGRSNTLTNIKKSVVLGKGGKAKLTILAPALAHSLESYTVTLDDGAQSKSMALTRIRRAGSSWRGWSHGIALVDMTFPEHIRDEIKTFIKRAQEHYRNIQHIEYKNKVPRGKRTPRPPILGYSIRTTQSPQTIKDWPTDWLAYSSYGAVMMKRAQFEKAPKGVQRALQQYVELGGLLYLLGPTKVPTRWAHAPKYHPKVSKRLLTVSPGFGECVLLDIIPKASWDTSLPLITIKEGVYLFTKWTQTPKFQRKIETIGQANKFLPVTKNVSVPVRSLFFLMLLFSILLGPVNIYYLAKKKKRLCLLWTVPLFSLAMCLLVLSYSLLSEGLDTSIKTNAFVFLDQPNKHASTVGIHGFYAPITPAGGLRFPSDMELIPQLRFRWGRGGRELGMSWDQQQHLSQNWIISRVPIHLSFRSSALRRERLVVSNKGNTVTALNGLGANIEKLWVADQDGYIYVAGEIAPGGKSTLSKKPYNILPKPRTLRGLYTKRNIHLFEKYDASTDVNPILKDPGSYLQKNSYIAVLSGSPFAKHNLKHVRKFEGHTIVYGIMRSTKHGR